MSKHQKGNSFREKKQRLAINKITNIANNTPDANVKITAIQSIKKLASQDTIDESDTAKKSSFFTHFVIPVGLSIFASFLWENGIKKAAAWLTATLLPAYMVNVYQDYLHVALQPLFT